MKLTKLINNVVRTIRRAPVMITLLVATGFFALPATGSAQGTDDSDFAENVITVGAGDDAADRTHVLFRNLRGLVGWILLVALVFAGLLAAFGQYKSAWGVAIAAIIIYGGTWVVGLIRNSLKD